jgi:hypothetical protein
MAPEGQMGQMEMKCIYDIGKIFLYKPRGFQVSDVAHGPLVLENVTVLGEEMDNDRKETINSPHY